MAHRDVTNPWGGGQSSATTSTTSSKPKPNQQRSANRISKQPAKKPNNQPTTPVPKITAAGANADRFQQAQSKHLEAARKIASQASYESSSDEEELAGESLLASVFKGYAGDDGQLSKTQQFLENVFQSGSAICLICIATVKRADYIWSCDDCHTFFHLACIQRWANDSCAQKRAAASTDVAYYNNRGEYVPKKNAPIQWDCPKCRRDYDYADIPRDYTCFCTKELNPPNHAWLVPHSCGEPCQKRLQPDCGHRCVLLCHPGPCPPCPQYVQRTCDCERSSARTIRCSQRSWQCQQKCNAPLACGSHRCARTCHAHGACPPCERRSQQRCECGAAVAERQCSERRWQCQRPCGLPYACGRHSCERRCHAAGECGPCPRGEPRSCPCGKERLTDAPCSVSVQPCGATCDRPLDCGAGEQHICAERCHSGPCGPCLLICAKRCRCGAQTRELPCSKPFACDTKCRQQRSCGKHACNRKCCDGVACPPCDKLCGRQLACGKHKCAAACHRGECYPCAQRSTVRCRCGATQAPVPCGRERRAKPPRCQQPCRLGAQRCHHERPHRCHAGECPACQLACGEPNTTSGCAHPCAVRCHDAVRVQVGAAGTSAAAADGSGRPAAGRRPAGPWDVQAAAEWVVKRLPHPPCAVPVAVTCVGGHETVPLPCSEALARSCGRACGRQLRCGNHRCALECHAVEALASTKQDEGCAPCTEGCASPRPDGCTHSCERACHLGPCAKCRVNIKFDCHCGVTPLYFRCGDFYATAIAAEERERMRSCGQRCTRNFLCGHRCLATCHSGPCPDAESCTKKVRIHCKCKTRKCDTTCDQQRAGQRLDCDERCAAKVEQLRQVADEAEQRQRAAEEERNRLELLEYEKKMGKRKPKERKQRVVEQETGLYDQWLRIGAAVAALIVAVTLVYIFK